ncbi:Hsp20/alpha crystallin family protein [Pontibacillus salicampi]|uniref:Hsp20/alpha crystallin family protein n=1 Tax=Pontibacillus salicampi TaxID=1449801 RepID=A0ABV6LPF8_9BACI
MKKDKGKLDWEAFSKNIDNVLGEDFWNEMHHMIPKRGPAYDMYEMEDHAVIIIELPDLRSPEEVILKQHGTDLILKGSLPYRYPVNKEDLLHQERLLGPFKRTIEIPFHYTPQDIRTTYKNGLLCIHIQKNSASDGIPIIMETEEETT